MKRSRSRVANTRRCASDELTSIRAKRLPDCVTKQRRVKPAFFKVLNLTSDSTLFLAVFTP